MSYMRRASDSSSKSRMTYTSGTILFLSTIVVLGLVFVGLELGYRFDQTDKYRTEQRSVWYAVICSIEQAVQHNPKVRNKQQVLRFYDKLLVKDIKVHGCGFASTKVGRR